VNARKIFRNKIIFSLVFLAAFMGFFLISGANPAYAETATASSDSSGSLQWGLIAAAIAFGLGALGAGIAIANVGSAAMGAIGEKPEIASQALIFVALAEGVVVFGFITALMILGKV